MKSVTARQHCISQRTEGSDRSAKGLSSAECALSLLERSIEFGHGQIAVVRLAMAVDTGAAIPIQSWEYCERVAKDSANPELQVIYSSAIAKVTFAVT